MNNKTLWTILGIIVVVALGIWVYKSQNPTNPTTSVTNNSTQNSSDQSSAQPTSLKSLLSSGSSQQCTFNDTASNTSGTVYVTSGHLRGDFTSTVNGATQKSHLISDGQTSYIWIDGMTTGFKTNFGATTQGNNQVQSVDPNKSIDYSCTSWNVDSNMFTVPTTIQFADLTAIQGSNSSPSTSTEACAGLTEPAKTQCMQSFR
ncbi:MAG TPA: hypothetical protein VL306_03225 [Methylomirabilota bacterium]|jgi:hypothetical protein|nr:hypothetical protein [Methylomirabilota bacterium]